MILIFWFIETYIFTKTAIAIAGIALVGCAIAQKPDVIIEKISDLATVSFNAGKGICDSTISSIYNGSSVGYDNIYTFVFGIKPALQHTVHWNREIVEATAFTWHYLFYQPWAYFLKGYCSCLEWLPTSFSVHPNEVSP